jgi:cytochrome P450
MMAVMQPADRPDTGAGRPTAPELTAPLFDDQFYAGDPHPTYARLRREAPLVWHEDPGLWIASTYADVMAVSRDPDRFCSAKGVLAFEIGVEYPSPPTMMHTDPPEHTFLRRAVAVGFRPSRVRALEPAVRERVQPLVDALPAGEPVDIVTSLTAPLPLMMIASLLGLPEDEWRTFLDYSNAIIPGASDFDDERRAELQSALESTLREHIARRRSAPTDDYVSDLVRHRDGGRSLDDEGVFMIVNQLLIAGNETTRNLMSGGLLALAERPEQWGRLREDRSLVPSAVEEMLRWTSPVVAFMRTATTDVELSGQHVRADDPLLLLYASANRDESEFGSTASEFDVGRRPNHHVAFGFGPHVCVGAALGRLEARLVLESLLDRFERLEVVGPVERTPSGIIAGVHRAVLALS